MSQPNKKSKIFIIIFALVAIVVTGFMIWYTLIYNVDTTTESTDAFYISTEKTSEGLSTYDTYDENAIIIEEIENGEYISYVQIDGLIDEEIENKINQELKDWIYSYDTEEVALYSGTEVYANYANVLSISCSRSVYDSEEDNYEEVETKTLNYDLTTGEPIVFYDLFVSESAGLSIIRDSAYIDLAEKYVENNIEDVGFDEETQDRSISTIDYGEIEEEVNYIVWCYRNNKIKDFYFNEQFIYYYIEDEIYRIFMADYMEDIAIYNRYSSVLAEEIYEDTSIAKTGLYVLTVTEDYEYQIMEETENYYVNLYVYPYDYDDEVGISEESMTFLKSKMDEMATEIKELAESEGKFYVVSCEFNETEDDELLVITEEKSVVISEISDWNTVKDKLLEYWRQKDPGFTLSPRDVVDEFQFDQEEDTAWTYSCGEYMFLYDSSSGEEIIPTNEETEEELRYLTQSLVCYEEFLGIAGYNEVEYCDSGDIFTEDELEIYWEKEIEQGYIKHEEVYVEGEDGEEGYYDDKYYLTEQDKNQFGNMNLLLEDESTYEIEILEKSSSKITANVTVKFFKDEDCKNEYEQAENVDELNLDDICDEVTIEIELKCIGYEWEDDEYTINWRINNYSIL